MSKGRLNISLKFVDPDFHELCIDATNGVFTGATNLFVEKNALRELAEGLSRFPEGPGGRFEWSAGIGDVRTKIVFERPGWRAAHVTVYLDAGDGTTRDVHGDHAQLTIQLDDAVFGNFVHEIHQVLFNQTGTASLVPID